jgi:ABC-type uncharacterized transport system substrate-binding protein
MLSASFPCKRESRSLQIPGFRVAKFETISNGQKGQKVSSDEWQVTGNFPSTPDSRPSWLGLSVIAFALVAAGAVAHAQQSTRVPRIGYLNDSPLGSFPKIRAEAFRQGLRELGYEEGKNIVIEWRYGDGKQDRVSDRAAQLVRLKVEIIVTAGTGATRSAKEATIAIPIVMTQDTDPVRNGFVASLARPGGNITGLSRLAPELSGKQVELLKEIVPKLSRLAVFGTSSSPANTESLKEIELAAGALGLKLQHLDVQGPKDFETAFREASKGHADAILMLVSGPVLNPHRTQVVDLAIKNRLPVIYRNRVDVEAGGLVSYGVNLTDLDRRAATYVDKILKGAKPADLPVEQPTKFEFVINLKAAKQIGLTIPPNVLARADKVIR